MVTIKRKSNEEGSIFIVISFAILGLALVSAVFATQIQSRTTANASIALQLDSANERAALSDITYTLTQENTSHPEIKPVYGWHYVNGPDSLNSNYSADPGSSDWSGLLSAGNDDNSTPGSGKNIWRWARLADPGYYTECKLGFSENDLTVTEGFPKQYVIIENLTRAPKSSYSDVVAGSNAGKPISDFYEVKRSCQLLGYFHGISIEQDGSIAITQDPKVTELFNAFAVYGQQGVTIKGKVQMTPALPSRRVGVGTAGTLTNTPTSGNTDGWTSYLFGPKAKCSATSLCNKVQVKAIDSPLSIGSTTISKWAISKEQGSTLKTGECQGNEDPFTIDWKGFESESVAVHLNKFPVFQNINGVPSNLCYRRFNMVPPSGMQYTPALDIRPDYKYGGYGDVDIALFDFQNLGALLTKSGTVGNYVNFNVGSNPQWTNMPGSQVRFFTNSNNTNVISGPPASTGYTAIFGGSIYAPNSTCQIKGSIKVYGSVICRSVEVDTSAEINWTPPNPYSILELETATTNPPTPLSQYRRIYYPISN